MLLLKNHFCLKKIFSEKPHKIFIIFLFWKKGFEPTIQKLYIDLANLHSLREKAQSNKLPA